MHLNQELLYLVLTNSMCSVLPIIPLTSIYINIYFFCSAEKNIYQIPPQLFQMHFPYNFSCKYHSHEITDQVLHQMKEL